MLLVFERVFALRKFFWSRDQSIHTTTNTYKPTEKLSSKRQTKEETFFSFGANREYTARSVCCYFFHACIQILVNVDVIGRHLCICNGGYVAAARSENKIRKEKSRKTQTVCVCVRCIASTVYVWPVSVSVCPEANCASFVLCLYVNVEKSTYKGNPNSWNSLIQRNWMYAKRKEKVETLFSSVDSSKEKRHRQYMANHSEMQFSSFQWYTNPLSHSALFFFFFFLVLHTFHFSIELFIQRLSAHSLDVISVIWSKNCHVFVRFICKLLVMSVSFKIIIVTSFAFKNVVCGCEIEATKTENKKTTCTSYHHSA